MIQKILIVKNELGLHARPCALIVQKIKDFKSTITFNADNITVDAKSILSLLSLPAPINTKIKITINGEDEHTVLDVITELFNNQFNEAYRSAT